MHFPKLTRWNWLKLAQLQINMSFIRCTSNPEGLYVYHNVDGTITWVGKGMETETKIPANLFYTFVKKMSYWNAEFKRGSLEIKETFYRTGKKLTPDIKRINEAYKAQGSQNLLVPGNTKITLFYKGVEVARMWPVTWRYIYDNVMGSIERNAAKKKKKAISK